MDKAIDEWTRKNTKLKVESINLENKIKEQKKEYDILFEKRIKELEDNEEFLKVASKCRELMATFNKEYYPNEEEFYDFRINHYNKEAEQLLKKLELDIEKIDKEDIIKEGTFEDYKNYIESKVEEND